MLHRVGARDADESALLVHALLQLRRGEDARRELQRSLGNFCVDPGSLLARASNEVLEHPDTEAAGWFGLNARLELVGELNLGTSARRLNVQLGSEPEFSQIIGAARPDGSAEFRFKLPHWVPGVAVRLGAGSHALLGAERLPSGFGLDARTTALGSRISGWLRLGWRPETPPALRFGDEAGRYHRVSLGRQARAASPTSRRSTGAPGSRWTFEFDARRLRFRGDRFEVSAQLPDGRWQPLPDSPLLLASAARLPRRNARRIARTRVTPAAACSVIIPVYRGRRETLACLESVLATVDRHARVVVVDDATDDAALALALDALAADGRITLLRNEQNQGFVRSVNRALDPHPDDDAVLLNSDTQVFGNWLARLRAAAYSAPKIATVTPFTNSGSIASYPSPKGQAMGADEAQALDTLAASLHAGVRAEIPVGVGFCLYLRRDALREVGGFDAGVFGRGYGEEVDYCLRAQRLGWSHRLAADVFVHHAGGVSFGTERAALFERAQRLLELRHPGFAASVAAFEKRDPLLPLRRELDERRLADFKGRFVLMTTLAMSGGVERFVDERCQAIRAQGLHPLLLRPVRAGVSGEVELSSEVLAAPGLRYRIPAEMGALSALLGRLPIASVELQHFLHLDARVIELVRELEAPYDAYAHDYAWICPRITLIDGSGRYCGEPAVSVCQSCVKRNGSNLGEKISVPALRRRSDAWLREARNVFAPTLDAAERLKRYFPGLAIEVRAPAGASGGSEDGLFPLTATPAAAGARVRVALVGGIGVHKGYRVLLACARDARARKLPLEFVVIGHTHSDAPLLATGRVFITGRYVEGEAAALLQRERPSLAFLPSVWPETWSYVLDEALAAGLPVVAFDLGAIAERLRAAGAGTLLPLRSTPEQINDRLLQLATQTSIIRTSGDRIMNRITEQQGAAQDGLSASVQVLPLPPGLYLFSVKSADAAPPPVDGQLRLPAMHVGLGPGVRAEQVEFIAGPSTNGAWLFAHDDLLVTKVNGHGATLVLNSIRGPGGEVLSIKVERLDTRADLLAAIHSNGEAQQPGLAAHGNGSNVQGAMAPSRARSGTNGNGTLPLRIAAHIRSRGDMNFTDADWVGRVAPGLWIESFSVRPLEQFGAEDIEYKGLTGSGFETPWLSDDEMCGTKGMAVPLVGFAVRLKPGPGTANCDCEYSGYFKSGVTVGPLRNGAPCRSTVANDPLEGIQLTIRRRASASTTVSASASTRTGSSIARAAARAAAVHKLVRKPSPTRRPAPAARQASRRRS